MSTEVTVDKLPLCDFCKDAGVDTDAAYDGRTNVGPWAWMCEMHYATYGVGLGTGSGQRLVLRK